MKKWVIILIFMLVLIVLGIVFGVYYLKNKNEAVTTSTVSPTPTPMVQKVTVVALGDSLTKAANPSQDLPGDHPEYSYSCGEKIESFAKLLEKDNNQVNCYNLSSSGATSEDVLQSQVEEAKKYDPSYVIMTVGGNDAAGGISTAVLKENTSKIIANFPKSKILVGNIPNLDEFRKNDYPACLTPLSQYRELEKLTAVYIITYNLQLKTLESGNVKIIDLFNLLGKTDVSSYDCMHFSIAGQEKTAQAFYQQIKE
jgi:lysophospholipase L1-like esterase